MLAAIEYWLGEMVNRSASTREKYKRYLLEFCRFVGMSPDELIEWRKADLKAEDIRDQRRMESLLKQFIAYLDSEGFSTSTRQVVYAAVRSFFDQNYMPLMMRRGDYPKGENIGHRAVTKEEIRRMLGEANLDQKAAILILKDSGLRVSDVVALTVGDLEPGLSNGNEFIPLRVITKKNKVAARTFLGPEAIEAIKAYLDHRRRGTRRMPKEEIGEASPLLRAHVSEEVRPLSRSGLSSAITWLADRIGVNGDVSAHSLRKYFQTRMEAAGVNPNWIDHMIGRKLPGVHGRYSLPTEEELFEKYRKAYPSLRVYEPKLSEDERVEVLKQQVVELQARLNQLTEARRESDDVMNRLFEDPEFRVLLTKKLKELKL